ncbi:hypothetical protein PV08_02264 [Exophiala spinifera]|uniref:FAD-binding domain-containing protein n=1 Tax=Exophiala spinifera TaxID=91928 RepID=A0A0D2CDQ7_9EURO|nr:uncharacterized protein PV08_02264 [Exophiala spinifera]KIW21684.1 hypothetical protein PV08_02264 [Exophiala spinifera]
MQRGNIGSVIIAGAGPVGLLTALFLGQRGIPVDVVEAATEVNDAPRGLAYGPAAVSVLARAGILENVIERGFIPADVSWRKPSGEWLVGLERLNNMVDGLPNTVILPVGALSTLLVEEVQKYSSVTIHWGHRVLVASQTEEKAWVEVEEQKSKATRRMEADFVIGCDGASSAVRKSISGSNFPGWTWPNQLVAVNARMNFDKLNFSDVQWVVDPENWFVIAKIDKGGLWRIVYGEPAGLSVEEIKSRLPDRLRTTFPGNPEPSEYQVTNVTPYVCHQRCAEKMRDNRILLAGDAAHLNNPMGGLGLTTGVCDVGSLVDCLYGIDSGEATLDILNKYDEIRRQIFDRVVDTMSTANFKRIMQGAAEFQESDLSYKMIMAARTDISITTAMRKHDMSIGCDMTQFYNKH